MGVITIHAPNRASVFTTQLAQYYGAQTSTNFEIISASGVMLESNIGENFTYSGGFFRTGTIKENYLFSGDGSLIFSATGLTFDVVDRNNSLSVGTSSAGYYRAIASGDDIITGSYGDDLFFGSRGNDSIDGGDGFDVLTFNGFGGAVTANLATGTVDTGFGTLLLTSIEDLEGSAYGDSLTGDAGRNLLQGFGGNDLLDGGLGFDTASFLDASSAVIVNLDTGAATGGSGSDTLVSIERVIGSRFADTLTGSSANETFVGGLGNDLIDGAGGVDTIEFINVGTGVGVNLTLGTTSGGAGVDSLVNIEHVSGSIFADQITGSAIANNLRGGAGNDSLLGAGGNDFLFGDAGNDTLRGGTGNDVLTGGEGRDAFRFDTALGTSAAPAIDRIMDFSIVDDTIQLDDAIFARYAGKSGPIGDQTFKVITTGQATDSNDFIVYDSGTGALFYDHSGGSNGLADAIQFATLSPGLPLSVADFIIV